MTAHNEVPLCKKTNALLLRNFLNEADILELLAASESVPQDETSDIVSDVSSDMSIQGVADTCFSDSHVALNLHRTGHLARVAPALQEKIVSGMRLQPGHWCDPSVAMLLNVRCVELHTYTVGGGLMTLGHRDHGSHLSMSMLISHAESMEGGQMMTWEEGRPILHAMSQLDGSCS